MSDSMADPMPDPMPDPMNAKPLRLRTRDAADLPVIAAQLQDAIVPVSEIGYDAEKKLFVLVANRFRWDIGEVDWSDEFGSDEADEEEAGASGAYYLRSQCGLQIRNVKQVRRRNLDLTERGRLLDLLTIATADDHVRLVFADDSEIDLEVGRLDVFMEDIGEPWISRHHPSHQGAEEESYGA
ncbi:MAG: DUF2948 family protein [Pseudomonadota bacterium]